MHLEINGEPDILQDPAAFRILEFVSSCQTYVLSHQTIQIYHTPVFV